MLLTRPRHICLPLAVGLVLLSACSSGETTAESCQRLDTLRLDLHEYETNPPTDPDARFATAEAIAGGFDDVRDTTQHPELSDAADALGEFYWTVLDIYYDNLLQGPDQVMAEVVDRIGIERLTEANLTYERICNGA